MLMMSVLWRHMTPYNWHHQ